MWQEAKRSVPVDQEGSNNYRNAYGHVLIQVKYFTCVSSPRTRPPPLARRGCQELED